jgi:hypothetical protein
MYESRNNSIVKALLQKSGIPRNPFKQIVILGSYDSIKISQPKCFLVKRLSTSIQREK